MSTTASHLQPVTSLVVDPTTAFFLSGSPDAMVHVWSLAQILSFAPDTDRSPVQTLSTHRAPITALVVGHSSTSANIAVSASEDKSAIVWDYHTGQLLRTYLLPDMPRAMALDPADRALYLAYADGSLHTVNFYDDMQKTTPADTLRDPTSSHRPLQPSSKARFGADSQKLGAAAALTLTWDGQTLVSGHSTGKVAVWDISKGAYLQTVANLPGPVTNLALLEPTGFPNAPEPTFKMQTVVRPRQDNGIISGSTAIPPNYTLTMQLNGRLRGPTVSATDLNADEAAFEEALMHPSFPQAILDASLAELAAWDPSSSGAMAPAADFLSLDEENAAGATQALELHEVKKQLASLQRVQKVTFQQLSALREEKEHLVREERKRFLRRKDRAKSTPNATNDGTSDVEMSEGFSESSPRNFTGEATPSE